MQHANRKLIADGGFKIGIGKWQLAANATFELQYARIWQQTNRFQQFLGAIMAALSIPCPQCKSNLKIPSRKFLGKKAKCPKCEHRFVLQEAQPEEPDEVELQLASTVAVTSTPAKSEIPLGINPVWVPDPGSRTVANSAAPVQSPAKPPAATQPAATQSSAASPPEATAAQEATAPIADADSGFSSEIPDVDTGQNPFAFVDEAAAPLSSTVSPTPDADASESRSMPTKPAAQVRRGGRRKGRRRNSKGTTAMAIGSALFVASMGGLWWQQSQKPIEAVTKKQPPAINQEWERQKVELAADNVAATQLSPTSGEPIPVEYMPFTPHLICHLRPAELWGADALHKEFIATCGHLGVWLGGRISEITRFEPQEIEELTFAINFGPRTTPPQVAAVVRLVSEQRPSDLQLNRFKGSVRPDLSATIYEADQFSYMPINNKTFVVAPVTMSDSLAEAKQYGELPMVDLEKLLKHTDRNRQLTLAFDIVNIDTHREYIFEEQMQDFADRMVLWFGKEIKTISLSLHLSQQEFFVETMLGPTAGNSAMTVKRTMQGRLEQLPEDLMAAARMMRPSVVGYRDMIGRFPAMMRATALGTTASVDAGVTRLVSYLPSKAASNLAAASLLTWNQSAVTDFSKQPMVAASETALPDSVIGRLQIPVIVDFRRMPLQEAFAYIADEIKTDIVINGDALKLSGMTQNMPQTYNLGEVTAMKAIDAIVSNPDYKGQLVVVVDEQQKQIQVTTAPVATETGLKILNTKQ